MQLARNRAPCRQSADDGKNLNYKTAKPIPQESDISLGLPGAVSQDEALDIPDEQRILITLEGSVVLNDLELGVPGDSELENLITTLTRFKKAADLNKSKPLVTLDPHDTTRHQRVVDVMNACARAGITGLTFADSSTGGSEG